MMPFVESECTSDWLETFTASRRGKRCRIAVMDEGLQRDGMTYLTRIDIDTDRYFARTDRARYQRQRWADIYDRLRSVGVDLGTLRPDPC